MIRCRQCGNPIDPIDEIEFDRLCPMCWSLNVFPDRLQTRTELNGIPFRDMKMLDEVARIGEIVEEIKKRPGQRIGVMVDHGGEHDGKGDRYIELIQKALPKATVADRVPGPVENTETITFILTP